MPSNGLCASRCVKPHPGASPYSALDDAGSLPQRVIRRGVADIADVLIRLVLGADRLRPPLRGAQVPAEVAEPAAVASSMFCGSTTPSPLASTP